MADKTYEIVSWPASEAYLKDPTSTAETPLKYAVVQNGVNALFHGPEEGGSRIGIVVEWDSYEDFKTLVANERGQHTKQRELFIPLRGLPGLEGQVKIMVTFTSDPKPALRAPVTEITISTLKPGAVLQSVSESFSKIVSRANSTDSPALGAALGSAIGESDKLVVVIGWNSVEDHKQAVEGRAKATLEEIFSQVDGDQHHYRLAQVSA